MNTDKKTNKNTNYSNAFESNDNIPSPWCPLPWSHVSIKSNGVYRVCCHSNTSRTRGVLKNKNQEDLHVSSTNWENMINSETLKSVRKNMLEGKWSKECVRCQREHETGMNSRNMYERRTLQELMGPQEYSYYSKAKKFTQKDGSISIKDFPISYLDIRFGNLCNLKCVMCGPTESSKWYEDHSKLSNTTYFHDHDKKVNIFKKNNTWMTEKNIYDWNDNPYFWSQMESQIQNFRKIYIVGGEPLLINHHYDFLQKCIDKSVAAKIVLEYNSNITEIPKRAFKLWNHFRLVKIGASIDGWGKINEFIRYPSKWDKIKRNLDKLNQAEGSLSLTVTVSVSLLNIWHFPEFIEKIMKVNFTNSNKSYSPVLTPHPVHKPFHLNVNILEEQSKQELIQHFNLYKEKISQFDWQSHYGKIHGYTWERKIKKVCEVLESYKQFLYKVNFSKQELDQHRKTFISYMDKLDEIRQTEWKKVLPELYQHSLSWREL